MIACRICGQTRPVGKKDRDRRNYWCNPCGNMYQEMKNAKRAKEWEEAERLAIERLKLNTTAPFVVSFK